MQAHFAILISQHHHNICKYILKKGLRLKVLQYWIENLTIWDPLNYDIKGSNNGEDFDTIKAFNEESSIACGHVNNRTYKLNKITIIL